MNAVLQEGLAKVEDKREAQVQEPQVGQGLGEVDRVGLPHGLALHEDPLAHKQVQEERLAEGDFLVHDRHRDLGSYLDPL